MQHYHQLWNLIDTSGPNQCNITIASTKWDDYFYTENETGYLLTCLAAASCCMDARTPSSYKLDENPTIYVEDALIGSWACFVQKPGSDKPEPVKCILSRKNDTEYNIAFTGYFKELKNFRGLQGDSIKGAAFMSTVNGRQFMNIDIESRTYIAEMKFENNTLSILPLSEHFTSKMVMNSQALRVCIEFHYKTRVHPMYDEEFCLKDMVKVN